MNKIKGLTITGWAIYLLWHLFFIIVALAVFLPYIVLPMINGVRIDSVPWIYAVYASVLTIIPFLSVAIVWRRFHGHVLAALKLFYAVEMPLMLLLLLRILLFRDAPFSAQFLMLIIFSGIIIYFFLLWRSVAPDNHSGSLVDLLSSSIVALVGLYLGLLLGIPLFPTTVFFLDEIVMTLGSISWDTIFNFTRGIFTNPLAALLIILLFMTMAFFLITPLILITVYIRQFFARCRVVALSRIAVVVASLLLVMTLVFSQSYQQPQQRAFELTQILPTNLESRRELINEAEVVREGLRNAYLGAYRYLSTTGSSRLVAKSYGDIFGKNSLIAEGAQQFFNGLASPFLYQGENFTSDKQLAADRYQQFFDTPIEKGEKQSILAAVRATWESEQSEAGLMNAASHYVLLTDQSIKVKEHGDSATVTITQTLLNQTYQAQEVVFHFELPEDAVVTGLWMSDDSDHPEKFEHVVTPRGAAQSVYKAEVQRRIDPALLEKVGPVQYRLRAFPIPARVVDHKKGSNRYRKAYRDFSVSAAAVQFQYRVSIDANGRWPMPVLLEKRNVYWNKQTARSHKVKSSANWLPDSLPSSNTPTAQTHTLLIEGQTIEAIPRDSRQPVDTFNTPIAVLVDGSYSMNEVEDVVQEQLHWLQSRGFNYELFFCQTTCTATNIRELENQVYFGNSQLLEQLSQWRTVTDKQYAAVFVLTDAGSYELSPDKALPFTTFVQPLWLVHLSEKLPYAYADTVIDAVNDSGGFIARSLAKATERFLWTQQLGQTIQEGMLIGVSQGYFWYQRDGQPTVEENDPFTALAADRWMTYLAANNDKTQLANLDYIHRVAKQFNIVSFYSSMLVLVDDRQRQLLQEAEAKDDRFEREVEIGVEALGNPEDAFSVPSVPEPEEWALLIIAGCLLLIAYTRKHRKNSLIV